ncbi:hypothetical protein ARMGADRAFT_1019228 [Armillaria gallica]|uniref:Uncharacterized protein n=1 Tax=Armillaria gallica TaxID=47427 RepID=A0A2H3D222_ARMGA|nr:hypothetical protein ARMGADRAFT_1019228 [Armillaria gallica]
MAHILRDTYKPQSHLVIIQRLSSNFSAVWILLQDSCVWQERGEDANGEMTELGVPTEKAADLFSGNFANKEISNNTQFARNAAAWTSQDFLVSRIEDADHHIANTTIFKEQYTINDHTVYSAAISRFNPKEDT